MHTVRARPRFALRATAPLGLVPLGLLMAGALPAWAHPGHEGGGGDFAAGFLHPLTGLDHVAAMVCVGIWAAVVGDRRVWAWPLAFVLAMLVGAMAGHAGVKVPGIEMGIAASVLVLGLAVALGVRAPVSVGGALIALFAVFHGMAHGAEAPAAGWAWFVTGFVAATAALHVTGIAFARGLERHGGRIPVRGLGVATAALGLSMVLT